MLNNKLTIYNDQLKIYGWIEKKDCTSIAEIFPWSSVLLDQPRQFCHTWGKKNMEVITVTGS
jgi:hypothetical protein